jgi:hypothetical protein
MDGTTHAAWLVQNQDVASTAPEPPRVTRGPRLDAVLDAMRDAETAVSSMTMGQHVAHAWSEQERLAFASALADLSARLMADPSDRSRFASFGDIGPSEIESDGSLMEAIIELDLRIGNLDEVESTLLDLQVHLADLEEVIRTDAATSEFTALTNQIFDAADRIIAKLLDGDYLTDDDLARWNDQMALVAQLARSRGPRSQRRAKDRWLAQVTHIDADISSMADKDRRDATDEDQHSHASDEKITHSARLEQLDAGVAKQLRALGYEELRNIATVVATNAVREVSLHDPRLSVLEELEDETAPFGDSPERSGLQDLVDELDEGEERLREAVDRGTARVTSVRTAYGQARAANAVWYALSSEPMEAAAGAICEAVAAMGDADGVLRFVRELLDTSLIGD